MHPLLTAAAMKKADEAAIEQLGMSASVLMEHAATALVDALQARFTTLLPTTRGIVVAGRGNNGGDVLASSRILLERGCRQIYVVLTADRQHLSPLTQKQLDTLGHLGMSWGRELSHAHLEACDWILDGIFGTGLARKIDGENLKYIEAINTVAGRKWIVSADIPSGLSADTGTPQPIAVRASQTVTFGFYKRGLVTGAAADYVGQLTLASIQIPPSVLSTPPDCFLYEASDAVLPLRRPSSHKGDFGKVAIVAGPPEKEGASALASLAALKSGAAMVTVHGDSKTLSGLRPRLPPEVMTEVLGDALFDNPSTCIVIGPGLGLDENAWKLLERCLASPNPLVVDADALTLLSKKAGAAKLLAERERIATVLTPHPKEASRLLQTSTEEVEANRFAAARKLADTWKTGILLKGKGSLCTAPGQPIVVVTAGDSGLSKGGSGDVLAGCLAAMLAQGLGASTATPLAAYVHGRSSELLTQGYGHTRSTLPSEVAQSIAVVLNELECRARHSPT